MGVAVVGLLLIFGAISNTTDKVGEVALLGFLILAGISAFVADRAARGVRSS